MHHYTEEDTKYTCDRGLIFPCNAHMQVFNIDPNKKDVET